MMSETNNPQPTLYTTNVAADPRGFVRISGVCVGRLIREGDAVYFEVKDRNANRAAGRGAEMLRVNIADLLRALTPG